MYDEPYDWEKETAGNSEPIEGQTSFFSRFFNNEEEINNISFSFEDIIYKNPSYSVAEIQRLYHEGEKLSRNDNF